jgi:hypothetical protein
MRGVRERKKEPDLCGAELQTASLGKMHSVLVRNPIWQPFPLIILESSN